MQADLVRWRIVQGLVVAILVASAAVAGPAVPKAQAGTFNPCNVPGGKVVCEKAEQGAKWLYDKSGSDLIVGGVSQAVDFASDPLGYLEQKMRSGTEGMFSAFGEALTGKKPSSPKNNKGEGN